MGLRGVPETIREAAIAYGASKWYLLRKVDLPLATPSILAGVNQTVMLSLAMVVVASLIGAKGLGQDVLEALQYANVGVGLENILLPSRWFLWNILAAFAEILEDCTASMSISETFRKL